MLAAVIALTAAIAPPNAAARERTEIREVVHRHLHEILRCNELGPMEDSLCTGWVNVRFWIAADGRVTRAVLARNTLAHTAIPACLLRTVRTWRFRRLGRRALEVVYPFHFRCAW